MYYIQPRTVIATVIQYFRKKKNSVDSVKMKNNMNTADSCDVAVENVEMEDDPVQEDTSDSRSHFSLRTTRKWKEDRKRRGLDTVDVKKWLLIVGSSLHQRIQNLTVG